MGYIQIKAVDASTALQHYGVMGMKWGIRKDRKPQGYQSSGKGSSKSKTVGSSTVSKASVRSMRKDRDKIHESVKNSEEYKAKAKEIKRLEDEEQQALEKVWKYTEDTELVDPDTWTVYEHYIDEKPRKMNKSEIQAYENYTKAKDKTREANVKYIHEVSEKTSKKLLDKYGEANMARLDKSDNTRATIEAGKILTVGLGVATAPIWMPLAGAAIYKAVKK